MGTHLKASLLEIRTHSHLCSLQAVCFAFVADLLHTAKDWGSLRADTACCGAVKKTEDVYLVNGVWNWVENSSKMLLAVSSINS